MSEIISTRKETIQCPECDTIQEATINHYEGHPFETILHDCIQCEHIIMEAEWEKVEDNKETSWQ